MKTKSIRHYFGGCSAALFITAAIGTAHAQISVDGTRDTVNETTYTQQAVQVTTSNWGGGNTLANLHTAQDGSDLAVFIGGKTSANATILFIDSKPGGITFIANNQIGSGGEEYTINNMATSASAGLTFENGFAPDYAVRIYGNGDGTQAHINRYDLVAGSRAYVGQTVASANPASAFVTEARTIWLDAAPPLADVTSGVEMKLSLAGLGVPNGAGQTVKLMAVLVNDNSTYASNQVLASRTAVTTDIGNGINAINFETEAGTQTVSLTVDNTDTDGDGTNNDEDTDDDNDGLLDIHENGGGTYVSATQTGTNPLIADTDSDGNSDGTEVDGSALGYVSNPNLPNYMAMTVPGSFNLPTAWTADTDANNPTTNMVQGSTASLITQYDWSLRYNFTAPANIEYKYAAGSWAKDWGNGGNNFAASASGTGFHTFTFNNATLVQSFGRTVFADSAAYLAAYGVIAGVDTDGDGILNEAEFAGNTDPTNDDTDEDGTLDAADTFPLFASRDIVFSVNMNVQEALGNFTPGVDGLVVDFFDGAAGATADLPLSDLDDDGIWTGTLPNFQGIAGTSFGTYKFRNLRAGAPSDGYEGSINNRTFNLGAANTAQVLDTVFFDDNSTLPGSGYSVWATANAGGQEASGDFDGDGVSNGVEYFMGQTGSSFTAGAFIAGNIVSWPKGGLYTGTYGTDYVLQTSSNLNTWVDVLAADPNLNDGSPLQYTLVPSSGPNFVRLKVIAP